MENFNFKILNKKRISTGFLKIDEYELEINNKTYKREVCVSHDAILVLPYDPVTKKVLLTREPRSGLLQHNSNDIISLSTISGCIDKPNKSINDIVKEELSEEAGILNFNESNLTLIKTHFSSIGIMSEKKHIYIYKMDSKDIKEGRYGNPEENEIIETELFSYDEAMLLCENNTILDLSCVYAIEHVTKKLI